MPPLISHDAFTQASWTTWLLQLPEILRDVARRLARTDAFAPMYYATGVRLRS